MKNSQTQSMKPLFPNSLGHILATGTGSFLISLIGTQPVLGAHLYFRNISATVNQQVEGLDWLNSLNFADIQNASGENFLVNDRPSSEIPPKKTTGESLQASHQSFSNKYYDSKGWENSAALVRSSRLSVSFIADRDLVLDIDRTKLAPLPNQIIRTEPVDRVKQPENLAVNIVNLNSTKITDNRSLNITNNSSNKQNTGVTTENVTANSNLNSNNSQEAVNSPAIAATNRDSIDSHQEDNLIGENTKSLGFMLKSIQLAFNLKFYHLLIVLLLVFIDYRQNHS